MSILIKGVEMPKSCHACWVTDYCLENHFGIFANGNGKPCPLVEIPTPHGRLIDADDVNNHIIGYVDLRDCPTIIDAEGGG